MRANKSIKAKGVIMEKQNIYTIFDFWQWLFARYFEHLEEMAKLSAQNYQKILVEKISEMDARMIKQGI